MKKKNLISLLTAVMIMVLSIGALAGCGEDASAAEAGTLVIKVNPEIAVDYDNEGKVVGVRGLNDDGKALVGSYSGFEGRASDSVVTELVTMIHEAGYFETEIEGEGRQITIEIEKGSEMPESYSSPISLRMSRLTWEISRLPGISLWKVRATTA